MMRLLCCWHPWLSRQSMEIINLRLYLIFSPGPLFHWCSYLQNNQTKFGGGVCCLDLEIFEASLVPQNGQIFYVHWLQKIILCEISFLLLFFFFLRAWLTSFPLANEKEHVSTMSSTLQSLPCKPRFSQGYENSVFHLTGCGTRLIQLVWFPLKPFNCRKINI